MEKWTLLEWDAGAAWTLLQVAMVIVLLVMLARRRSQHGRAIAELDRLIAAARAARARAPAAWEVIELDKRRR